MPLYFSLILYYLFSITNSIQVGIPDEKISFGNYTIVLDANWRWIHYPNQYTNCFDGRWTCGQNCDQCVVEGVNIDKYKNTYGIEVINKNTLRMNFITGSNIGSRIYLLDGDKYYYPNLINKEIRLDIDLSNVGCGLNAAVYLVEMKSDAYPTLGGGYVDAQCPTDIKIKPDGKFNTDFSNKACGVEIDLIEANNDAMAFTLHPCIENSCYSAGSDFNSYRQGYKDFYGLHKAVDTTKPFTVITQFIGDSNNNLVELRRSYKQNNKIIDHPAGYMNKSSISYWMKKLNEPDDLDKYGGFESLTKSLKNGMALVLSIWDDTATNMKWLDVGERGRCSGDEIPRNIYRDAYVIYSNLQINDISTKSDLSCTSSRAKDIDCSCIYNCFVKNDQFK